MAKKYLMVGGVAGGAGAAARLRRLDEQAEIIMFEKGPFVSFSNCGLPYHISGKIETQEKLILMTPEKFDKQYNIEARVNNEVIAINKDEKTVTVLNHVTGEEYKESYDKLVVSPGAKAIVPPFEGLEKMPHFTLKTVPDTVAIVDHVKNNGVKHMTVIGGGFIGLEAAENLREAGCEVTLIEAMPHCMKAFDEEMAHFAHRALMEHGVELMLGEFVTGFDTGKVLLKSGKEVETDGVILSIGVAPDTEFMKESGLKMGERGHIIVNENYQTSDENIYAAGDAIIVKNGITGDDFPLAMAGPANKQARLIADHINGREIMNKGFIGSGVARLFDYVVANTGLNERDCKEKGIEYEVAYNGHVDRVGIMPGSTPIFLKLIFEKGTGKILGAQGASKGAVDKRMDVIATAIKAGMNVYDLSDLELCYAPPVGTGKDAVNQAGWLASNLVDQDYKQVSYTEVYDLVKQGAQIIDVREEGEYALGHVKGAINIPMSEFRERLEDFDKSKPVYVHCRTGQRSYNVALALQTHGFDVYNIAGSYLFLSFYEDVMTRLDSSREEILTEPNFN